HLGNGPLHKTPQPEIFDLPVISSTPGGADSRGSTLRLRLLAACHRRCDCGPIEKEMARAGRDEFPRLSHRIHGDVADLARPAPPALPLHARHSLSLTRRYNADGILTVSDTLADYFAKARYPRERIQPIYYGFDSELFPFRARTLWNGTRPPIIVMHGSLDHHH